MCFAYSQPLRKQMGNLKTKLSQIAKLKDRETGGDKLTA